MPVQRPRRLTVPTPSLYDRMAAEALHHVGWRWELATIEREHPELIVERAANIIVAQPAGQSAHLLYSFGSQRQFTELFPSMFEAILPRLRRVLPQAQRVRLRLWHNPAKPVVEPVLKKLWFSPTRDWLEFTIGRAARPPVASPRGVRFRDAAPADAAAIDALDSEAFPNSPIPIDAIANQLTSDDWHTELALIGRDVVGFCTSRRGDPGIGHISTVAVSERARGRGIGGALTLRAAKELFRDGAQSVVLTTDQENAPAIRLYMKLGFRQTRAGRDYTRPTDPKAVARLKRESKGTLIKFGGWR